MAKDKLHTGVWVRQVLKGKKMVRISYIPDSLGETQSTLRKYKEEEKSTWVELLGDPDPEDVDIDEGITFLRFSKDNNTCYATWLPRSGDKRIFNIIERPDPENGDGMGGAEYRKCMNDNADKSWIEANAQCMGQWLL